MLQKIFSRPQQIHPTFPDTYVRDHVLLLRQLNYVGDAHVPLHTSSNHDGQLTNQKGIHAFWESQLPELFGDSYNFNTGNAAYIADVNAETWRIIKNSHDLVDTLLRVERDLSSAFPKDSIYLHDKLGNLVKNKFKQTIHSTEYARQYHILLRGMVENQMRGAIAAIANYWFTAWVNAGKPDFRAGRSLVQRRNAQPLRP